MVAFRKMTEEEFHGFKEASVADYAEDLMKGQRICRERAMKDAAIDLPG